MTDSPYPYIDEQLIQDSMEPMAALGWVYRESERQPRRLAENILRWWTHRVRACADIDVNDGALHNSTVNEPFSTRDGAGGRIGFNTPLAAVAFLQLQGEQL